MVGVIKRGVNSWPARSAVSSRSKPLFGFSSPVILGLRETVAGRVASGSPTVAPEGVRIRTVSRCLIGKKSGQRDLESRILKIEFGNLFSVSRVEAAIYSLFANIGVRPSLERELLPFMAALIIAQIWFKWGSFALELVGFMAVWFALGFVGELLLRALRR